MLICKRFGIEYVHFIILKQCELLFSDQSYVTSPNKIKHKYLDINARTYAMLCCAHLRFHFAVANIAIHNTNEAQDIRYNRQQRAQDSCLAPQVRALDILCTVRLAPISHGVVQNTFNTTEHTHTKRTRDGTANRTPAAIPKSTHHRASTFKNIIKNIVHIYTKKERKACPEAMAWRVAKMCAHTQSHVSFHSHSVASVLWFSLFAWLFIICIVHFVYRLSLHLCWIAAADFEDIFIACSSAQRHRQDSILSIQTNMPMPEHCQTGCEQPPPPTQNARPCAASLYIIVYSMTSNSRRWQAIRTCLILRNAR